jgi:hypothetical protein
MGVTLSKNPAKGENVNLRLCWENGVRVAKDKRRMVIFKQLINTNTFVLALIGMTSVLLAGSCQGG